MSSAMTLLTPIFSAFPAKPRCQTLFSRRITTVLAQASPSVRENASQSLTTLHKNPPASAYIHLPFCRKRCHYCDFPIVALGSNNFSNENDDPRISNYINLLIREINATNPGFDTNPPLKTVFFGGGTPSLVPPRLVSSVLDALDAKFGVSQRAEISMEMDPGTFDAEKMKGLVDLGVNRVSLGVQAFQDELLKACGRAHGVGEVYEAIEIVSSCGVENWSLDLISSLPNQTLRMWEESLRLAVDAKPKHVSVYDLQVEQGTKFGNLYTPGEFPLPSESQSADFYKMASATLSSAGYNHYEVSSYCKDGFECKHNLTYWNTKPFYAFGLGSASYIKGVRFSRPKKMGPYLSYVEELEYKAVDLCEDGLVDSKNLATDILMLSLRTAKGLDVKPFEKAFGRSLVRDLCKAYRRYVETGHVVCLDEKRRVVTESEFNEFLAKGGQVSDRVAYLRLSDPDGFLLSNELISIAFGVIGL